MRNTFIETLVELAEKDSRIFLTVGDIGFNAIEPFANRFPNQFLNVGVAEQNMTSVSTGMAMSGKIVFTYSIGNFPTIRCLEQIRNDVCYHDANVKVVSVGGGVVYGALGASHHALEDIAIMRALPRMRVIAPSDPVEAKLAVKAIAEADGPFYLRLAKNGEPNIHSNKPEFALGNAIKIREGTDITLISTGQILANVIEVAENLSTKGIKSRVLSMHTIKPIDELALAEAVNETNAIFTVEEHSKIGGLGSAVAETISEFNQPIPLFKRISMPADFCKLAGSQSYLREVNGLSVEGIANQITSTLNSKKI